MRSQIKTYNQIVKDLKMDYPKLSDFELLSLAVQIERNQIIENAFVVSYSDSNPTGLEAIAIALGYNKNVQ